ncbi:MAG: helix-turn-helix domain-containing protein [Planctomycetaceae bacterium]
MTYTVRDVQVRYDVTEHTVLGWIRNGELKALNVGTAPGKKKPRWRITQEALDEFELLRASQAPPPPRKRRKRQSTDTMKFY